jgi:c-di-GMP-related signal transduction protein
MEVFVARQPIFNKKKKIVGYELLFRGGMSNIFPSIDGNIASSSLLAESFFSIGMERLTGGKKAFINFTRELLIQKVPTMFPQSAMMVEVLEDVEPTPEVIEACREMASEGYQIVLDDFIYRAEFKPLLAFSKIIKIDYMASSAQEIKASLNLMAGYPVKFLAEKVETPEAFQEALEMGFEYFQGYFFSKPVVVKGRDIPPDRISLLRVMAEVNKEDYKLEELEMHISHDVSMSYKLLRLINSSYFRRVREISSIRQAIVLLGEKGIRQFISLIAMSHLASDKPDELVRASIVRARLCELLGKETPRAVDSSSLFTLGLFSFIDAILDDEMGAIMKRLPLSANIKMALVEGTGELMDYLALVHAYESANWETVFDLAARLGIQEEKMPALYINAVGWADGCSEV